MDILAIKVSPKKDVLLIAHGPILVKPVCQQIIFQETGH